MSQDKAVEAAIPDPEVVVQAERRRSAASLGSVHGIASTRLFTQRLIGHFLSI